MLEALYIRKAGTGVVQNLSWAVPQGEIWKIYSIYMRGVVLSGGTNPVMVCLISAIKENKEINRIFMISFDDSLGITDIGLQLPCKDIICAAGTIFQSTLDVGLKDYPFNLNSNQRISLNVTAAVVDTWDFVVLLERFKLKGGIEV